MKIFGIGYTKTGTRSLLTALTLLGYKGAKYHEDFNRWWQTHNNYRNILKNKKFINFIKKYNSFSDWPFCILYKELDRHYPRSKFILTIRKNKDTWERSKKGHAIKRKILKAKGKGKYIGPKSLPPRLEYEEYNKTVREYFKNRSNDFLVMCFEKGDGWKKLCSFLKVAPLNIPFPHKNKALTKL